MTTKKEEKTSKLKDLQTGWYSKPKKVKKWKSSVRIKGMGK